VASAPTQQQQGCNCGNGVGMKPTTGTTPPGQPPVSTGWRPTQGTMPQIAPEGPGMMPATRTLPTLFGGNNSYLPHVQPQQNFGTLFDMVKGRMF
jgi:hypothetical protein